MEKTKTQSLLAEDFFFDSKSRCNVVKGKVSQLGQREHVRDAEERSAGLPLHPQHPAVPKKKKEKSQHQSQSHRSWSKPASRGSRSQLLCSPIHWQA